MSSLLYSTLIIFKFKKMFLFGPCFSMKTNPRKPSIFLVGFLRQKKRTVQAPFGQRRDWSSPAPAGIGLD
jgi:hypothetical protein